MSSSLHVIRGLVWVTVFLFTGGPHHDAAPGHVGPLESWTRNGSQKMGSKKRRPWGYPQSVMARGSRVNARVPFWYCQNNQGLEPNMNASTEDGTTCLAKTLRQHGGRLNDGCRTGCSSSSSGHGGRLNVRQYCCPASLQAPRNNGASRGAESPNGTRFAR